MSDFQIRMQKSLTAHQNFKNVLRDWRSGRLKDAKGLKPHTEPKSVIDARNDFLAANDELFGLKIEPLEKKFEENSSKSLDEVLEFLSIDLPAFRCGYAKEFFLKWLKQTNFSVSEIEKIKCVIIEVCETESFRREFRRWSRLAMKIADENFVKKLQKLAEGENRFARVKAHWILQGIYQNRLDLRVKLNEN